MTRPLTSLEARERLLVQLADLSRLWANMNCKSEQARCNGLVHSILTVVDGVARDYPAMDLVLQPLASERRTGENYFEEAQIINDDAKLSEMWRQFAYEADHDRNPD